MKTIKISLAIAVIGLITFFVINSLTTLVEPPPPPPVENQFTKIIDEEINALKTLKVISFKDLKASYENVKFDIDDYYGENRLGKNQSQNNQSKERLSKNLYSIYVVKFINLTNSVFRKSDWNPQDITFIRNESKTLKNSKFLQKGNGVDIQIIQIQNVLSKYDEINKFISSCKEFSYSNNELNSAFPITTIKQKISRAVTYKNNKLENSFVNNCTVLHNQLNETTKFLFNAHVRFLNGKIDRYKGWYSKKDPSGEYTFNSAGAYADEFYKKMKNEINGLDNDIYHVSNLDNEYEKLIAKLNKENSNAMTFFSNN
ncbi:hypothetical protein GCM10022389_20840 [Flavobacterium cheonanense]|uniref:Uncharacterized protein n=1 Tax=Flavobacterium cheonanense TaxID=706183 RepID=A0ABP7VV10_9FLAO